MPIVECQLPFVKVCEMLPSLRRECQEYEIIAFCSVIDSCFFVIIDTWHSLPLIERRPSRANICDNISCRMVNISPTFRWQQYYFHWMCLVAAVGTEVKYLCRYSSTYLVETLVTSALNGREWIASPVCHFFPKISLYPSIRKRCKP
jgi:hypothetical protein